MNEKPLNCTLEMSALYVNVNFISMKLFVEKGTLRTGAFPFQLLPLNQLCDRTLKHLVNAQLTVV